MKTETVTQMAQYLRRQIEKELKPPVGARVSAYIYPNRVATLGVRCVWEKPSAEEFRLTLVVIDPGRDQNYTVLIFDNNALSEKFVDACTAAHLIPVLQKLLQQHTEYLAEKARKAALYATLVAQLRDATYDLPTGVTLSINPPTQHDFPDIYIAIDHMAWSVTLERAQPIIDAIARMVAEVSAITRQKANAGGSGTS